MLSIAIKKLHFQHIPRFSFLLSDVILSLDNFPFSSLGFGRKVAIVGVGSAGCRITHQLSMENRLIEHLVYLSCDEEDLASITRGERILVDVTQSGKASPYVVRGMASTKMPEIKNAIADSKIVFIIAGLGGNVGSGLAPLVAKAASEAKAVCVGLMIMPYNFESSKHFFAGSALGQIRKYASGVIVIDSDELLESKLPLIDMYADLNQRIALALSKLLGSAGPNEFCVGLNSVVNFVKNEKYSVLCIGESPEKPNEYREAVMRTAKRFDKTVDCSQASKSIVHLCADESITMKDLVTSIGGLSGVLGNGTMQVEYGLSSKTSCATSRTAIIMATGFQTTKFDRYDPLEYVLSSVSSNLDEDMDSSVFLESPLLGDMERE